MMSSNRQMGILGRRPNRTLGEGGALLYRPATFNNDATNAWHRRRVSTSTLSVERTRTDAQPNAMAQVAGIRNFETNDVMLWAASISVTNSRSKLHLRCAQGCFPGH
jgi:hypothetical protein